MTVPGQQIGVYKVVREIASGGGGTVYEAVDTTLSRTVALKVLHPQWAQDDEFIERFSREALITAQIDHGNVVRIYQVGVEDGLHYIAMEFVPGGLDRLLGNGNSLPWPEARELVIQIADGLDAAHQLGVVHRDIKPANILITDAGTPKITDFGIARLDALTSMTVTVSVGVKMYP